MESSTQEEQQGNRGEQLMKDELYALCEKHPELELKIIDNRKLPDSYQIDFIVIARSGIWVVDAKLVGKKGKKLSPVKVCYKTIEYKGEKITDLALCYKDKGEYKDKRSKKKPPPIKQVSDHAKIIEDELVKHFGIRELHVEPLVGFVSESNVDFELEKDKVGVVCKNEGEVSNRILNSPYKAWWSKAKAAAMERHLLKISGPYEGGFKEQHIKEVQEKRGEVKQKGRGEITAADNSKKQFDSNKEWVVRVKASLVPQPGPGDLVTVQFQSGSQKEVKLGKLLKEFNDAFIYDREEESTIYTTTDPNGNTILSNGRKQISRTAKKIRPNYPPPTKQIKEWETKKEEIREKEREARRKRSLWIGVVIGSLILIAVLITFANIPFNIERTPSSANALALIADAESAASRDDWAEAREIFGKAARLGSERGARGILLAEEVLAGHQQIRGMLDGKTPSTAAIKDGMFAAALSRDAERDLRRLRALFDEVWEALVGSGQ